MNRPSTSLVLAALIALGASCNGNSGGTDGGGGTTSGTGGHAGAGGGSSGGSGGHPGGSGGTGGHASGGQGGIDNLCLAQGQPCGATGPLCCSGLMCCYDSNGQASCVPGSCTGSPGGHGGGGAGGNGSGGAGGAGGSQTFSCGSDTCTEGESFCYTYTPGTAGQTGRSCHSTPAACASMPTSCDCLCPTSSNASLGCMPVGMGSGNYCLCSTTGGAVNIVCEGV